MSEIRWPTEQEDAWWDFNHRKECTSKTGHCTRAKRVSETEARIRCLCGWVEIIPQEEDWDEFCRKWDEVREAHYKEVLSPVSPTA